MATWFLSTKMLVSPSPQREPQYLVCPIAIAILRGNHSNLLANGTALYAAQALLAFSIRTHEVVLQMATDV